MSKKHICFAVSFACAVLFSFFINVDLNAQITSPNANFIDSTQYPVHEEQDPVFVFNKSKGQTDDDLDSLQMDSPDGEDDWVFQWYAYDTVTNGFDFTTPLKSENNVASSNITDLSSGGYAVVFTNGIFMDTARAWVFINAFADVPVRITHKDNEGNLLPSRYTCDYVELKADVATDTFYYYDPENDSLLLLPNHVDYTWTSEPAGKEPAESETRFTSASIRSRTYDPPTEDTHYFLEVTDRFGVSQYDTVFYETIQTKAVLDTLAPPVTFNNGGQYYNTQKKDTKSAPFQMFFNPKESENAERYLWEIKSMDSDTIEYDSTYYSNDSLEYIFYLPGTYNAVLTTYSEENCQSSDSVEITIAESELGVPPFFTPKEDQPRLDASDFVTPNGDGNNDYFRVYDVSIREFEIVIFNRWGRVVNRSKGSDIRDWMGWDGYIGNTSRPAPEGVYYFVLRAKGFDGVSYEYPHRKIEEIKGFFHLFRENRR